MTSVEAFAHLGPQFDRLVRSLDVSVVLEFVRRLEPAAYVRNFKGFRPQTLGRKRIVESLRREVYERGNVAVGDVLVLLWNQEHRDVYHDMLDHVKTIDEDVEKVEKIEDAKAAEFVDDLQARYERDDILICVRLNDVKFSEEVIASRLSAEPAGDSEQSPGSP